MSFVASLLSIIMTIATYFAYKTSHQKSIFVSYFVEFRNDEISELSEEQKDMYLLHFGQNMRSSRSL